MNDFAQLGWPGAFAIVGLALSAALAFWALMWASRR